MKAVAEKKEPKKEKKEPEKEKEKEEPKKEEPKKKKRHCKTCHKERMTDDESEVTAKKDSPKKDDAKNDDAGDKDKHKDKTEKSGDKKGDGDKKSDAAEKKDDSASKKVDAVEKAAEAKAEEPKKTDRGKKSDAGEWTSEQDAKLLDLKATTKLSWVHIGEKVGHPGKPNCQNRWKELTGNGEKGGDGGKAAGKEKESAPAGPGWDDLPAEAWIGGAPDAWPTNDAASGEESAAAMTGGIDDENFGADLFTSGSWVGGDSGGNNDTPAQDSGNKSSNRGGKKNKEKGKKGNNNDKGNSNSASNTGDVTWGNNLVDAEPTGPTNTWGDETPADTTWGNNPVDAEPTNNWGNETLADVPADIPNFNSNNDGGENRSNWNMGRGNHFGGGYNTAKAHGRLQANNIWSTSDCEVLEMLEARYTEHKWLHMQAEFYNWTGRMVTAEMIREKFKKDGCA